MKPATKKSHIRIKCTSLTYGFTFIELLIVLIITGLIFGVGFANYRDYQKRQVLESAARLVISDLRAAQENASAGVKPATGSCSASSQSALNGYELYISAAGSYNIRVNCVAATEIVKTVNLPTPVQFTASPNYIQNGTTVSTILFNILGRGAAIPTPPGSATMTLTGGTLSDGTTITKVINVSVGGQIY